MRASPRTLRARSKPSMRGISMSTSITFGSAVRHLLEGVDAVLGGDHRVALALEQAAGDLAHGERVVDHHDHRPAPPSPRPAAWPAAARWWQCAAERAVGEVHRVHDQRDGAVGEHRGAGDAGHARELRADALHHDFLVAEQLVDVHARRAGCRCAAAAPSCRPAARSRRARRAAAAANAAGRCGPGTRSCGSRSGRRARRLSGAAPARPSPRRARSCCRRCAPARPGSPPA